MAHFKLAIKVILTVFTTDRIAGRPGVPPSRAGVPEVMHPQTKLTYRHKYQLTWWFTSPLPPLPSAPRHSPPRASLNSHLFTDSADHTDVWTKLQTERHVIMQKLLKTAVLFRQINGDYSFSSVVVIGTTDRPVTHTTMINQFNNRSYNISTDYTKCLLHCQW